MNQKTIQEVVAEIRPLLTGRYLGKIFQLAAYSYAIDFGLREGKYLFVSVDPASPRLYLIERRVKDLEKQSIPHSPFAQTLRAKLGGAQLLKITQEPLDRVVSLSFQTKDELGVADTSLLIVQLTGRSSNLFLLDSEKRIANALRTIKGAGQSIGDEYAAPEAVGKRREPELMLVDNINSISAALDSYYQKKDAEDSFHQRSRNLQNKLRKEINQQLKLKENLKNDLAAHGDPEGHKRLGDLLLANISTAQREGSMIRIKDFYTEGSPTIELQVDENSSLADEAARYFIRYGKSKRAKAEVVARLSGIERKIESLQSKAAALDRAIELRDEGALAAFEEPAPKPRRGPGRRSEPVKIPGVRFYRSTDGYEILVGRGARDNDYLTFRVAKPNDLWLHAADYPGSHVVVRRENRNEIPQRTVIEAAQVAAWFSQANKDAKVAVHYTPRKFLAKPKGAAAGLVRMSTFKTILVEPKEAVERIVHR